MNGLGWLSKLLGGNSLPPMGVPGTPVGGGGFSPGSSPISSPFGPASRPPLGLAGYAPYGVGALGGPMQPVSGIPGLSPPPIGSTDDSDWRSRIRGGAEDVGGFLKDNAGALAGAGSALLGTRERGQELEFEKQKYADEQERKKRIADALAPLYQQTQSQQQGIAPNPYRR